MPPPSRVTGKSSCPEIGAASPWQSQRPAHAPSAIAAICAEGSDEQDNDRNRGKRDAGAGSIGREGSRHAPDGLCDDRDGDELEPVQETFGNRSGECGCAHRKGEQDQGGWHREREPGREAAKKPVAAQDTQGKADLAGGRSREELAQCHQVGVARLIDPSPTHHQLVAEVTEMRDGAAKRCRCRV